MQCPKCGRQTVDCQACTGGRAIRPGLLGLRTALAYSVPVTTWPQLLDAIKANYKFDQEFRDGSGGIKAVTLRFDTPSGRSQTLLVGSVTHEGGEWVTLQAPIGSVGGADLLGLLRDADEMLVGGVALHEDNLLFVHAQRLENMVWSDFFHPMSLVVVAADQLKAFVKVVGSR